MQSEESMYVYIEHMSDIHKQNKFVIMLRTLIVHVVLANFDS